MTLYDEYWGNMTDVMIESLSMRPQSKSSVSRIDDLNCQSGWVQHYAVKQIERERKSILVDDYKITNFTKELNDTALEKLLSKPVRLEKM